MKRTTHARFINVGKDSPAYVDKQPTHGTVYTSVEDDLAGRLKAWICTLCDVTVANKYNHFKTKRHMQLFAKMNKHEGGLGNVSQCRKCRALIVLIGYGWNKTRTIWNDGQWITKWEDRYVPCPA